MENTADAKTPGTGSADDIGKVPAGAKPAKNVKFQVYKVNDNEGKFPTDQTFTLNQKGGVVESITAKGVTYTVAAGKTDLTTGADGIAKTGDLNDGVYLVVELDSDNVTVTENGKDVKIEVVKAAPFLLNLPYTKVDGTGVINDVHVFPKNQTMVPTKTPEGGSSVAVGDTKTWKISMNVPAKMAESKALVITDVLDEALTYTADSVKVYGIKGETTDLIAGAVTESLEANTVKFTFNPDKFAEIAGYEKLEIKFDTVVNSKILDKINGTVENNAGFEFTDKDGIKHDFNTKDPGKIHTGTILVKKVDETGKALDGAVFHIASSKANAEAGKYLKKAADGTVLDSEDEGYDAATEWTGTTETGKVGQIKFGGIQDSILEGNLEKARSYWLVETKAPANYNKLSGPVEVTFDGTASETNGYVKEKTVENSKGFVLPSTGGMGTMLFTIAGIVLVGIAGTMLVLSRKKNTSC
ncbi:MAG: SpaH/EbpB family LPXTG-anchored major pilin [Anaerovoracaceae bacterium]